MNRIFTVGVVAVQGAFEEHCSALGKLGVSVKEIRSPSDLSPNIDGLIFPGGESTAQGKLLRESGLFDMILPMIKGGLPVYGTCAGMVLLAKRIENDDGRRGPWSASSGSLSPSRPNCVWWIAPAPAPSLLPPWSAPGAS